MHRLLREMVKSLADGNQDWKSSHALLPNKLTMEFEPENDATASMERLKFISSDTNSPKKN